MSTNLIKNTSFTVQANQAWQDTGIDIQADMSVTISYQGGLWTADPATNNGELYSAAGFSGVTVTQPLYPLDGVNMGALVGQIGDNPVFLIGAEPTTVPTGQTGNLKLCINDDLTGAYGAGLSDNSGSVSMYIYNKNTVPDLAMPLITEPAQTYPPEPKASSLGPLEYLIGTWTNKTLSAGESSNSYNIMPLPQVDPESPTGYILKNFSYYEELTFSAIHGNAPNRGGLGTQVANTIFYEQRVYFAEGPNKDALVHAENGSLLFLTDKKQDLGPYGNGDLPGNGDRFVADSTAPTQQFNIIKQVSVPHGNSILAAGSFSNNKGAPNISAPPVILPVGVSTEQYLQQSVGNPTPEFTANPNLPLSRAISENEPTSFIQVDVDSQNGGGSVTNIGFEQQHAKVTRYYITYWLEAFNNSEDYTQLQYSQTILMDIPIPNKGTISFPHITTNTLIKKTG